MFTAWRETGAMDRIVARFHPSSGAPTDLVDVSNARLAQNLGDFAVAATADAFLVVWREIELEKWEFKMRVVMRRYDANGVALDPAPVDITERIPPGYAETGVSAIGDGSSFVVSWFSRISTNYGDIAQNLFVVRIPSRGEVDPQPLTVAVEDAILGPQLVRLGGKITVLQQVRLNRRKSITARTLGDDLAAGSSNFLQDQKAFVAMDEVVFLPMEHLYFSAAANDHELLLAWSDPDARFHCVHSRRFTANLIAIEPPHMVGCAPNDDPYEYVHGYQPAAGWDGRNWWVTATYRSGLIQMNAWRLAADGSAGAPLSVVAGDQGPGDAALVPVPGGIFAMYVRADETVAYSTRAFMRSIGTAQRRRAVTR